MSSPDKLLDLIVHDKKIKELSLRRENKRCFDCCTMAPECICIDFWIFVCKRCGDLHKESGHQVKPAFETWFTSKEVRALQEGGNYPAQKFYLKHWGDFHCFRHEYTHDRLREFIKYVFKEKVFMGSGSSPPKEEIPFMDEWIATPDKVEDPLDKYVTRISEAPQTNRSKADDSSALTQKYKQIMKEKIKEAEEQEKMFQEINDRLRYCHGNYECFDCNTKAPDYFLPDFSWIFVCKRCGDLHKEFGHRVGRLFDYEFTSEEFRALKEGGNIPAQQLYLKNWGKDHGLRSKYKPDRLREFIKDVFEEKRFMDNVSSPPKEEDGSALAQKTESSSSLPSSSRNTPEVKLETTNKDLSNLDAGVNYNWVTFEDVKAIDAPQVQQASSVIAPISSFATSPSSGASAWQDPQPSFPPNVGQPLTNQPTSPPAGVWNNDQPQVIHPSSTIQGHPNTPLPHVSHQISNPATETSSISASGPSVDVNPSGRKELPEHLFSAQYPSYPAAVPGLGMISSYGMGMPTPYYDVPMPSSQQPSRSRNPFDFGSEQPPVQTPNLAWQPSLPSSLSNPSHAWNPPGYGQMLPPQPQPHPSAMATGPYMGQVEPTVAMSSHENIGSFGGEGTASSSSDKYQHPSTSSTSSASSSSNLPPKGRNPFDE